MEIASKVEEAHTPKPSYSRTTYTVSTNIDQETHIAMIAIITKAVTKPILETA